MSIWTRAELIENIALWKKAYRAVIFGKSYTVGNRSLTRLDIAEIEKRLRNLQAELDALDGKASGLSYIRVGMVR